MIVIFPVNLLESSRVEAAHSFWWHRPSGQSFSLIMSCKPVVPNLFLLVSIEYEAMSILANPRQKFHLYKFNRRWCFLIRLFLTPEEVKRYSILQDKAKKTMNGKKWIFTISVIISKQCSVWCHLKESDVFKSWPDSVDRYISVSVSCNIQPKDKQFVSQLPLLHHHNRIEVYNGLRYCWHLRTKRILLFCSSITVFNKSFESQKELFSV